MDYGVFGQETCPKLRTKQFTSFMPIIILSLISSPNYDEENDIRHACVQWSFDSA